ncbi:putative transcriptional regulator love [Triangularia setosa]|uniref:Transcriptional regulator love n=1 Tax=Triangularia setosa TaxID=2587417 RepID=A0AAN7A6C8_9PEZI|nr:putative transcriptional regulator love [Podospora setosa]
MTPNQTHQSIRSSCDRCRSQKLKCTLSPEPGPGNTSSEREGHRPCQRCSKARVPCVFSRRLRTAKERSRSNTGPTSCPVQQQQQQIQVAPISAVDEPVSAMQHDNLRRVHSWASSPTPSFTGSMTPEQSDYEKDGLDDLSFGYGPDGCWTDMAGICAGDLSLITPALTSSPGPATETDQQSVFWDSPFSAFPASTAGPDKPQVLQRLLNLVVEIQAGFRLLESKSWLQQDPATGNTLDSYPIGTVLHLSKEFASIVNTAQEHTSGVAIPSPTVESDGFHFSISSPVLTSDGSTIDSDSLTMSPGATHHCGLDTPTRLLILTSYVSLTKLYATMLRHFQKYLSLLPSPSTVPEIEMGDWRSGADKRCLNLGELPPSTDVTHCSRIHTAVRLLLGSLERIEAVIELPVGLRSTSGTNSSAPSNMGWVMPDWEGLDLGQTQGRNSEFDMDTTDQGSYFFPLLRQEAMMCAGGLQEGFVELSGRAASVKELLREKMGL